MPLNKSSFLNKIKKGIGITTRNFQLTDEEKKEFNKTVANSRQTKIRKGSTPDQLSAMNDTVKKYIINKRKK